MFLASVVRFTWTNICHPRFQVHGRRFLPESARLQEILLVSGQRTIQSGHCGESVLVPIRFGLQHADRFVRLHPQRCVQLESDHRSVSLSNLAPNNELYSSHNNITRPVESSTAAYTTTTSRPSRIVTTRKSTSTTTEQPDDSEEYEEDDDDTPAAVPQFTETLDEEDPKVIKELIDLIKKVGGIEQLERQLNIDSKSTAGSGSSESKSPAVAAKPLISKALYDKVLNSASGRSFMPRNRYSFATNRTGASSSVASSVASTGGIKIEPALLIQAAVGNKYSSVIRNGRPSAQSDGIAASDDDKPVQQAVVSSQAAQRPQYVTIQRPTVKPSSKESDEDGGEEDDADVVEADDDDADEDDDAVVVRNRNGHVSTTAHPQYVNIQRNRGSTTAKPNAEDGSDDDDEDENVPAQRKKASADKEGEAKRTSVGGIRYVVEQN